MSQLDKLSAIPLFSHFTPEDFTLLRRVMEVREHPAGFALLQENKRAASQFTGMYVLLEGEVRVTAAKPQGGYAVDKKMGPGNVFGMVALLDDRPRSATVTCITPCVVAFLGRPGFQELYSAGLPVSARFQRLLARQMARDLRHLGQLLHQAVHGDDSALVETMGRKEP